jgi:hypothetical protein
MSPENLSRRTLVASAATLSALAVPGVASAAPARAAEASTTLPPELIERFVRVRAWYLDYVQRETIWSDEVDRRFYAATGLTSDQLRDLGRADPRRKELEAVEKKVYAEVPPYGDETECDLLCDERWDVARAIIDHKPQTVVDLAWQLEAWLLADLETYLHSASDGSEGLMRTLFRYIRTLGALPQPDDPLGALSINMDDDEAVQS